MKYKKVTEIYGRAIYVDETGYFTVDYLPLANGTGYDVLTSLGKTAKKVEKNVIKYFNLLPGKRYYEIINAIKELPDIK